MSRLFVVVAASMLVGPLGWVTEAPAQISESAAQQNETGATAVSPGDTSQAQDRIDKQMPPRLGEQRGTDQFQGESGRRNEQSELILTEERVRRAFQGVHTVEGEVINIDKTKGTLSVKTADAGTLELQFPSSALQSVEKGDRVSIELAMHPGSGITQPRQTGPATSPGTAPSPSIEQR
jgi:hypothetical protein